MNKKPTILTVVLIPAKEELKQGETPPVVLFNFLLSSVYIFSAK